MMTILMVGLFFISVAQAQTNNLITENSVGNVKIGMTITEVRNVVKPMVLSFELEEFDQGSFRTMVWVKKSNKENELPLFVLGVDQEKLISDPNAVVKINEDAKVSLIQVWSANFKTKEGIYAGMPIVEAEKKLGKMIGICWTSINNGREYITFQNQPKGISLTVQGVEQDGGEYGDIYYKDKRRGRVTSKTTEQAYIREIIVNDHPFGDNQ